MSIYAYLSYLTSVKRSVPAGIEQEAVEPGIVERVGCLGAEGG
jgi:hypothetical protein